MMDVYSSDSNDLIIAEDEPEPPVTNGKEMPVDNAEKLYAALRIQKGKKTKAERTRMMYDRFRQKQLEKKNRLSANEDGPIIQFFKRLIFNNNAQNILLTNNQLEEILAKEFDFKLSTLHELEIEIYISLLKKYVKDWPHWDDFGRTTKELSGTGKEEDLKKQLDISHENMKKFLKTKLNIAKPMIVEWAKKAKRELKETVKDAPEEPSQESVVLEVNATREQLNKLIYRHPHSGYNETIFKTENAAPSQIKLKTLSLEAILNWWSVRIVISLPWVPLTNCTFLKRETIHETDFLLVNKKVRKRQQPSVPLNNQIQLKQTKKNTIISTEDILACLDLLTNLQGKYAADGMDIIIACLKKDIQKLPYCIAPNQYRRYLSKHPYVRYLYSEVEGTKKKKMKYDIQLKETVRPMHRFTIGRIDGEMDSSLFEDWLKVECIACSLTFSGQNLATDLKQHFNECHSEEPDWQCCNCEESFTMAHLAECWWEHDCVQQNK